MGKKQGVNQTFGLSCQDNAVLNAKEKKVEIGQVGRKWAFCFIGKEAARKEEQKQRGDAAHPEIHPNNLPFVCAFPATSFPFP